MAPDAPEHEPGHQKPQAPEMAAPSLRDCLEVFLDAITSLPPARAASVRSQLDLVMGRHEMRDDVLAELLHLLALPSASPGKRTGTGG